MLASWTLVYRELVLRTFYLGRVPRTYERALYIIVPTHCIDLSCHNTCKSNWCSLHLGLPNYQIPCIHNALVTEIGLWVWSMSIHANESKYCTGHCRQSDPVMWETAMVKFPCFPTAKCWMCHRKLIKTTYCGLSDSAPKYVYNAFLYLKCIDMIDCSYEMGCIYNAIFYYYYNVSCLL